MCNISPSVMQVSYLRYGLMVRHIIDKKSPIFGHTMESLKEGDASFSLTIMGLERTSMQPIFHLEVSDTSFALGSRIVNVGCKNISSEHDTDFVVISWQDHTDKRPVVCWR